ncbi:MAG: PorV/PorQ family protein [archaeon]
MRRTLFTGMIFIIITHLAQAGDLKLAQTGFQFLSVGSDARGCALANAMTTREFGSGALQYNPAGMARMKQKLDLTISQNNWIDNIKYNGFSLAVSPSGGRYGVVGLSFMAVDYGEVQGTMVWGNDQGYIDTEIMHPGAFSGGIGYAKTLTDKFAVGGHVKVAGQQLGNNLILTGEGGDSLKVKENVLVTTAYDFGTIYQTGFKSLAFGMSVNNFSREVKYEQENFELPLTFKIGLSFDLMDLMPTLGEHNDLLLSVDVLHPRDYPEQMNIGLEYRLKELLAVRCGYMVVSDEQNVSFGFGLQKYGLGIDYAYAPFGVFDNVQMFTLRFIY